jgi:hypothetical protein
MSGCNAPSRYFPRRAADGGRPSRPYCHANEHALAVVRKWPTAHHWNYVPPSSSHSRCRGVDPAPVTGSITESCRTVLNPSGKSSIHRWFFLRLPIHQRLSHDKPRLSRQMDRQSNAHRQGWTCLTVANSIKEARQVLQSRN